MGAWGWRRLGAGHSPWSLLGLLLLGEGFDDLLLLGLQPLLAAFPRLLGLGAPRLRLVPAGWGLSGGLGTAPPRPDTVPTVPSVPEALLTSHMTPLDPGVFPPGAVLGSPVSAQSEQIQLFPLKDTVGFCNPSPPQSIIHHHSGSGISQFSLLSEHQNPTRTPHCSAPTASPAQFGIESCQNPPGMPHRGEYSC